MAICGRNGRNIHPSPATIAKRTTYGERTVKGFMTLGVARGWLIQETTVNGKPKYHSSGIPVHALAIPQDALECIPTPEAQSRDALERTPGMLAFELASTLDDEGKGNLLGALAGFANALLGAIDDILEYARNAGVTGLTQTADDVLAAMSVGFINPDDYHFGFA